MTTAAPAPGATPPRPMVVVAALIALLIPVVVTALMVAGAARAEPDDRSKGANPPTERTP